MQIKLLEIENPKNQDFFTLRQLRRHFTANCQNLACNKNPVILHLSQNGAMQLCN
jgi:hypothetical protein